jgi:hypothetical protein
MRYVIVNKFEMFDAGKTRPGELACLVPDQAAFGVGADVQQGEEG